jgi:hypothetical protein
MVNKHFAERCNHVPDAQPDLPWKLSDVVVLQGFRMCPWNDRSRHIPVVKFVTAAIVRQPRSEKYNAKVLAMLLIHPSQQGF